MPLAFAIPAQAQVVMNRAVSIQQGIGMSGSASSLRCWAGYLASLFSLRMPSRAEHAPAQRAQPVMLLRAARRHCGGQWLLVRAQWPSLRPGLAWQCMALRLVCRAGWRMAEVLMLGLEIRGTKTCADTLMCDQVVWEVVLCTFALFVVIVSLASLNTLNSVLYHLVNLGPGLC